MSSYDDYKETARVRAEEDKAILKEVRTDKELLLEVRNRILRREVHQQLMDLAKDAVYNGKIQVNSIEDFCTLVELDLFLLNETTV